MRDSGDDRLLEHQVLLLGDPRPLAVAERRAHVEWHTVPACDLDGPRHHHPRARRGHLEHFLVGDLRQLQRVGDDARVGSEDAFHVSVDLARSTECRGESDRGRVGPAAAERRDLQLRRHALEAGDQHDLVAIELGV